MTLARALAKLRADGRTSWSPGIRIGVAGSKADAYRIVGPDPGEPERFLTVPDETFRRGRRPWFGTVGAIANPIDCTDPATVGCLMALLRQALAEPYLRTEHSVHIGWSVYLPSGEMLYPDSPVHASEGAAIAAALIHIAGAR